MSGISPRMVSPPMSEDEFSEVSPPHPEMDNYRKASYEKSRRRDRGRGRSRSYDRRSRSRHGSSRRYRRRRDNSRSWRDRRRRSRSDTHRRRKRARSRDTRAHSPPKSISVAKTAVDSKTASVPALTHDWFCGGCSTVNGKTSQVCCSCQARFSLDDCYELAEQKNRTLGAAKVPAVEIVKSEVFTIPTYANNDELRAILLEIYKSYDDCCDARKKFYNDNVSVLYENQTTAAAIPITAVKTESSAKLPKKTDGAPVSRAAELKAKLEEKKRMLEEKKKAASTPQKAEPAPEAAAEENKSDAMTVASVGDSQLHLWKQAEDSSVVVPDGIPPTITASKPVAADSQAVSLSSLKTSALLEKIAAKKAALSKNATANGNSVSAAAGRSALPGSQAARKDTAHNGGKSGSNQPKTKNVTVFGIQAPPMFRQLQKSHGENGNLIVFDRVPVKVCRRIIPNYEAKEEADGQ